MPQPLDPRHPAPPEPQAQPTVPAEEMQQLVSELLPHLWAGVVVLDADLRLVSWHARAESLTGYTLAEMTAIGWLALFEPRAMMRHILAQGLVGVPTQGDYFQLRSAAGQVVPVVVQCSPLQHRKAEKREVVVVFRELTFLQERLRRDEHLALLGQLAGALSHEIRNPLNAILLYVDLLDEEVQKPLADHQTQMTETLADIRQELLRMNDLVQDYLSLARLAHVHRESMECGAFVKAVALELQEPLTARGITLCLEGLEDLGQVTIHANALHRVFLNLLQNAMEAMPQGGTLTLSGSRESDQIQITIHDTGCGIPAEQLPLLFTPFHTTKPDGTGLGLYVVCQIIAGHAGHITVNSTPERGTTFLITLPLEPQAGAQHP